MKRTAASLVLASIVVALATATAAEKDKDKDKDKPVSVFPKGAKEPQIAIAPDGKIFVAAGTGAGIEVASSTDGGKTFGKPVKVADPIKLMVGARRGPRIAATEKALVVTAVAKDGAVEGELLSWRSEDQGATWKGPVRINTKSGATREGLQTIAAGPKEEMAAVWLDLRNTLTELWSAHSNDGGATWIEETVAYRSSEKDGHICECCHPSLSWSQKGDLTAMFRNVFEGSRDMWIVTSPSRGKTWQKPAKLGSGTWPLKFCPMDGGAIAIMPDGQTSTSWLRDGEIFVSELNHSDKPERSLGTGAQSWVAQGPSGFYYVWLDKRGGDVSASVPAGFKTFVKKLGSGATDPVVAGALDGKGPVVAAWQTDDGVQASVLAPRGR